ncbi:MFS transporter [Streptomyces sp. NPDC020801]|uniref:MFS transporter n=1 Tax=unclassified Streptomyces TaxID=2593676 RepID=UPI00379AEBCB
MAPVGEAGRIHRACPAFQVLTPEKQELIWLQSAGGPRVAPPSPSDFTERTMATPPEVLTAPSGSKSRHTSSSAFVITICALVTVMEGYSLIVYGSVVPLLLADAHMDIQPDIAGVIGSVVYAGMLVGAFGAGVVGDRMGRKPALVASVTLFMLGGVASGLSQSALTLGLARLLAGLGVGGAVTSALALARDHAPRNRSSLVVNVTMAGIPLGGVLTAFIGMAVLPRLGWRAMFFIGSALTLVILLATLTLRPGNVPETAAAARTRSTFREMFTGRGLLIAVLIAAAAIPNMFTWFGLNIWLTEIMSRLDYPLTSALMFSMTLTGGAIVGSLLTSWWADLWGAAKVGAVTAACTLTGLLGVMLGIRSLPFLVVCIALMGAGAHTTMNLINAAASNLFPAHMRGTALGWANSSSYVGALGPIAAGLLLQAGLGPYSVFLLYAVSAALCTAVMTTFAITTRRDA